MRQTNLPKIDPRSPLPRYVQAKVILTEAIRRGVFPRGAKLPETAEVARRLRVSLVTAHKAIKCLASEGWLERGPGRGTFVRNDFEDRVAAMACYRIGLLVEPGLPMDDHVCGTLLQGLREASAGDHSSVELFIQREHSRGTMLCQQAHGFISLRPSRTTLKLLEDLDDSVPVVVLGGAYRDTTLHCVDSDDEQGVRMAIRHLAGLGHREIAIVTGPLAKAHNLHRYRGYLAEAKELGLPLRTHHILAADESGMTGATRRRLVETLSGHLRPTAIIASDQNLAMDVMALARQLDVRIPQELSLVGFDDPKSASLLSPSLTTIRQPLSEMACRAMERMLCLLGHTDSHPRVQVLPTDLIVRDSTAQAPAEWSETPGVRLGSPGTYSATEPVA